MAGGLVAGLRHQEAARFSFLLATPVIVGAGVVEVPGLFGRGFQWASTCSARCSPALRPTRAPAFCCATFGPAGSTPTPPTARLREPRLWFCYGDTR